MDTSTTPLIYPETFPLSVIYGRAKEQIEAGKYDVVNDNIVNTFSTEKTGEEQFEATLFHFNRYSTVSDVAIKEMEVQGFRPADHDGLIGFGKKFPEEQRKYPIVQLGSVCEHHGECSVSCLAEWANRRGLGLFCWDNKWDNHCRFFAFRK